MRLAIVAVGTQGDIQPALVLGQGLMSAGHSVRFITAEYYLEHARTLGFDAVNLNSPDPRSTMTAVQASTIAASRWRRYVQILQPTGTPTPEQKTRLVETCRGVDLILSNYGLTRHPAEHLNIGYIGFGVTPIHPTREFPHPLTRLRRSPSSGFNLATHWAVSLLFWNRERRWVKQWRLALGLATERFAAIRHRAHAAPFVYGISPTVLPPPTDWPGNIRIAGYWIPSEPQDWQPSPELVEFLRSGPPPIAVGFGSLVDPDPTGLRQMLTGAIRAAGVRALILGGWGPRGQTTTEVANEQIHVTDWVPFSWLLPRISALVHHAGSGSCAQALRAGVPSVCIAYSGEQWFWAGRLKSLQACADRMTRRTLSVERLALAIRRVENDAALRTATQQLATRIAREDGVKRGVEAVEEFAKGVIRAN